MKNVVPKSESLKNVVPKITTSLSWVGKKYFRFSNCLKGGKEAKW